MVNDENVKYPIGRLQPRENFDADYRRTCIEKIRILPAKLRNIQLGLTDSDLSKVYRTGSWNIRQIIHHIADSHMMGYLRIKHTLTEHKPIIKLFEEGDWALLADYALPVESSIKILEGIHEHMVILFESLNDSDWERGFVHPSSNAKVSMGKILDIYAWHGDHHLAQIESALRIVTVIA